ncbi:hypothetical protein CAPTEDRAFT_186486 [Capitella teleta]|uniref:Uncharacterized protein n=1 Tax=Capitella teleta TaxID=283909 RepID=R7U3U2_CAPTE|nr:hypothetical protein CAPTEDRAFT_186486 [Capitella teleta]|eukprot:ELT98326.1 hypothetical protein CAPTEDRAFT_186486 [Capitella teleta]
MSVPIGSRVQHCSMVHWQPFAFASGILGLVFSLMCFRFICRGRSSRRFSPNHQSTNQTVHFNKQKQSVNITTGNDVTNNNKVNAHSLSKITDGVVSISGVTIEDTVTDSGEMNNGNRPFQAHGVCHYESEEPQTLIVHENYPPGFDHSSISNFKTTLYDYEFSTKQLDADEMNKQNKDLVVHDSSELERVITNKSTKEANH